ncbi:MAG: nucleotidyl transferase AbiEii/AbiGii toxin family protein [Spirochaetales bacterium]|nr:nucleotidyl transferase AbiEii/AbiGii toxin family protein [Spirochaetales bacterium]
MSEKTMSLKAKIRNVDAYGGHRVKILSEYDTIITPLQIDITTGDAITPKEVLYLFKMIFEDGEIGIWAYNIETLLAEKIETILRRGEINTRPRDFYDIYILTKTQNFDPLILKEALKSTVEHRETSYLFNNINNRIDEIENSKALKKRWEKYTKDYTYAKDIQYNNIIEVLKTLI